MALEDWIDIGRGVIDLANDWGQQPVWSSTGTQLAPAYPSTVPVGAPVGTGDPYYNGQGRLCKRRRRQRNILTQANIGIMWQISNLPNNANVRIALAKAIR